MRHSHAAPVRGLRHIAAAVLLTTAAAAPVRAAQPELSATLGGTMAIAGDVDGGGFAFSGAALWALLDRRMAVGVTGVADDLGSTAPDPAATSAGSGQVHRATYGAAWRLDGRILGPSWEPFGGGTWGFYYLRDDRLGATLNDWISTGFSLGGGVRHVTRGRGTIGAVLRYHQLFNDRMGRYASAALEWGWR